jgi:hypothetical protein
MVRIGRKKAATVERDTLQDQLMGCAEDAAGSRCIRTVPFGRRPVCGAPQTVDGCETGLAVDHPRPAHPLRASHNLQTFPRFPARK